MILKYLLFVSLVCARITDVTAYRISHDVNTKKDTAFLGRFVFAPEERSNFRYDIKFPVPAEFSNTNDNDDSKTPLVKPEPIPVIGDSSPSNIGAMMENPPSKENLPENHNMYLSYMLVMYNDAPGQWPYVRANEDVLTCRERQKVATDGGMVAINLNANTNPGLCTQIEEDGAPWVHCRGERTWSGYDRPRWWFTTLQNCGSHPEPGVRAIVDIQMTNGEDGPLDLLKEFSADKTWLLPTNTTALVVLIGMVIVATSFCWLLSKSRLLHVTFRLYFVSVILQFLAVCFLVAGLVDFAKDGVDDAPNRMVFGHVLSWIASVVFVLVVILVAKGYTVTRGRISTTGWVKLTVYITLYCISYAGIYFYIHVIADPRDTYYMYDTTAGYCLIVLRCVGTFWLVYAAGFTVKHFPSKRPFYFMFTMLFSSWFISEPILILITNGWFESHNRAQAVNAGYWMITLAGHAFWLGLFIPCDINHNFPFHVRTCQIGFSDGNSANQNNKYAADVSDDFLGVFVNPQDAERKPVFPKVNNYFQEAANVIPDNKNVNAVTTNNNTAKQSRTKKRDTPVGDMVAMKTDYSIFQTGFVAVDLVVPRDDKPSTGDSNQDADLRAGQQSFVSVQIEG